MWDPVIYKAQNEWLGLWDCKIGSPGKAKIDDLDCSNINTSHLSGLKRMTLITVLQFQVICTNGNIRRIRARESTVLVSTCCVEYRYLSFLLCVARWGARGESGLRNFERLPSQGFSYFQIWIGSQDSSWKSKYEQVSRNYPENPNINRFPGSILKTQIWTGPQDLSWKRYIRFPSYKKE